MTRRLLRTPDAVAIASLAALLLGGCQALQELPARLLDARTARERYEARLTFIGLNLTAAGRDWLDAGERALRDAPLVASPHVEEGFLVPTEPTALGVRVAVRRGQQVVFELDFVDDTSTTAFLDAWAADPEAPDGFRRVASADSGVRRLEFTPRREGEFVMRAQPELLRGGRFTLSLRVAPTLAFPVERGRESDIGSRFGAPREGGRRRHHGIDIFARRGTPVVAAATGVVSRVQQTEIGGKVVWLRDRDGHALYYAHLDRQAVYEGDRVSFGDTVGFVGNTGNARTTPPHLHFGVYRRGEGPIDPWWFVARVRGTAPRLVADTSLLGGTVRTAADTELLPTLGREGSEASAVLPRHTVLRTIAAVGDAYRVRMPDGTIGFVAAALIEPVDTPIEIADVDRRQPLLVRPSRPHRTDDVLAEAAAGDTLDLLGVFGNHRYVRLPTGEAGWLSAPD